MPRIRPRPGTGRSLRSGEELAIRRIRWTLAIFALLVVASTVKLVQIQVVDAADLAAVGERQRARTVELPASRGRIYDRDGDVLATSIQAATVYADPRAYRGTTTPEGREVPPAGDAAAVADALAPLLEAEAEAVRTRLEQDRHFVYLARQVEHELGEEIAALGLPGIGVLAEPQRVYPAGTLAGQPGTLLLERAPGGLDIASGIRELQPPVVGTDVVLTLDRNIQHVAELAADDALERFDAAGASIVVADVGSGDVLAMASAPGFDPNARGDEDPADRRNRAVTDVFEPGSTQKALTIAAALEEGVIDPTTTLEVPDALQVGGSTFTDATRHSLDAWTITQIMERSSNVGTIRIAQRLGPERLDGYLRRFGYGQRTDLGFPGESGGLLMPHTEWWGTSLPTIAIGHGVAVSLLQLANSYATLANDGVSVPSRLVRGTVGEDGRLSPSPAGSSHQVVSPDTAAAVRGMLEEAVHGAHGTGSLAQVEGYRVAGKTGTARKPMVDGRGYSDQYIATFVGMAPADDPQVVVAVMVDEPYPFFGGLVAAPVFAEVMEAALLALRVPPDGSGTDLPTAVRLAAEQAAVSAERAVSTADAAAATVESARQEGEDGQEAPAGEGADDAADPP